MKVYSAKDRRSDRVLLPFVLVEVVIAEPEMMRDLD